MSATAIAAGIVAILPLLDQAIKDDNYKEYKRYQNLINQMMSQYNLTLTQLNNIISKYQTKYSEAVDAIRSSVRGSTANKVALSKKRGAKEGIESTQAEISKKTKQYEAAINATKEKQAKYENSGLTDLLDKAGGGNGILSNNFMSGPGKGVY